MSEDMTICHLQNQWLKINFLMHFWLDRKANLQLLLDQKKIHDHNEPEPRLTCFGDPEDGIKRKKKKKKGE